MTLPPEVFPTVFEYYCSADGGGGGKDTTGGRRTYEVQREACRILEKRCLFVQCGSALETFTGCQQFGTKNLVQTKALFVVFIFDVFSAPVSGSVSFSVRAVCARCAF